MTAVVSLDLGTPASWLPVDAKPACAGDWAPFDALIDNPRGRYVESHVRNVLDICGHCPIAELCYEKNASEEWVQTVKGVAGGRKRMPAERRTCGTPSGSSAHYKRGGSACDACRVVTARISREYRAKRRAEREAAA